MCRNRGSRIPFPLKLLGKLPKAGISTLDIFFSSKFPEVLSEACIALKITSQTITELVPARYKSSDWKAPARKLSSRLVYLKLVVQPKEDTELLYTAK